MARILILDSSDFLRTYVDRVLSAAGHDVQVSADWETGKQLLEKRTPDLVFVGRRLTDFDGIKCIREIRAAFPALRMAGVTSKDAGSGGPLPVGRKFGADRVLVRPFGTDELMTFVADMLAPRVAPPLSGRAPLGSDVVTPVLREPAPVRVPEIRRSKTA